MLVKCCVFMWFFSVWYQSIAQYHQTDYNVNLKIIEFSDYNHSYISNPKLGLQWLNRTTRVINGNYTLLKDAGMHLKMNIQMYKLLSNEYRFFPVTFTVNLCEEVPRNMFGMKDVLSKYSNIPLVCPDRKGFYYVRHGKIDFSQFPPYFPTGDYKLEAKIFDGNNYVLEVDGYATVTDNRKL